MWKVRVGVAAWVLAVTAPLMQAQSGLPSEVAKYGYADMIVVNGKVVSMDDDGFNTNVGHVYQAMAIKGTRILGLGTNTHIRTLADANTKVIDLAGQTVIPGIIETHSHLFGDEQMGNQMGVRSPDKGINLLVQAGKDRETTRLKVENAITDAVSKLPPGDWVRVGITSNRQENITRNRVFDWVARGELEPKERLDRLAPNNPVMVQQASRATMNEAGWELARKYISPHFDEYLAEEIEDVSDVAKKGIIAVSGQVAIEWNIWYRNQPLSLLAEMIRREHEMVAANGVTTFSSRIHNPRIVDAIALLHREEQDPLRYAMLYEVHRKPNNPEFVRQFYTMTGNLMGMGDDRLWITGVASELWDSSFPQVCLGPDMPAPPEIKVREMCREPGNLYWDTLRNALESGWRLAGIHGVGSDGVRRFIQMVEQAMKNAGLTVEDIRQRRLTIEHAEALGTPPDVMAKLKEYGIIISAGIPRLVRVNDYVQDYGPGVEKFMLPIKSWLDRGIRVVGQEAATGLGSAIYQATARQVDGRVILPEERLDRVHALKMWTTWARYYVLKEDQMGTLEAGKLADFAVLDRDIFTIPLEEIPKIRPQMTVMGGKVTHLEGGFAKKLGLEPVGFQFPEGDEPWNAADRYRFD